MPISWMKVGMSLPQNPTSDCLVCTYVCGGLDWKVPREGLGATGRTGLEGATGRTGLEGATGRTGLEGAMGNSRLEGRKDRTGR